MSKNKRDFDTDSNISNLVLGGMVGVATVASVGIAYKACSISEASLRLSAAIANMTIEGAQRTVQTIGSGTAASIQAAHQIADAIMAGGVTAANTAGNTASVIAQTGANSVHSIRTRSRWISDWERNTSTEIDLSLIADETEEQEQADSHDSTEIRYDVRRSQDGVLTLFRFREESVLERVMTIDERLFPNISTLPYEDMVQIAIDLAHAPLYTVGSDSENEEYVRIERAEDDGTTWSEADSDDSFHSALSTQISS